MAIRRSWIMLALLLAGLALAIPGAVVLGDEGDSTGGPSRTVQAATALGTSFTYQGRLEEDGGPAAGAFDFRFVLFDDEVGGAQVGATVTLPSVTVVSGLFTVDLDFGGGIFVGEGRWLEVAVRQAGSPSFFGVLSPRQPIRAVPYALYAKAAELALPFIGTGATTSPDPLFSVTQSGSGVAISARRTYSGEIEAPALFGANAGAGAGVQGETSAAGAAAVRGVATGESSVGLDGSAAVAGGVGGRFQGETGAVLASSDGTVALELGGGALKVSGEVRPAFVQQVETTGDDANICGTNGTVLDHPLLNGTPTAIVLVSHVSAMGLTASEADSRELVLAYGPVTTCALSADRWVVFGSGAPLAEGEAFNLLVVNQ